MSETVEIDCPTCGKVSVILAGLSKDEALRSHMAYRHGVPSVTDPLKLAEEIETKEPWITGFMPQERRLIAAALRLADATGCTDDGYLCNFCAGAVEKHRPDCVYDLFRAARDA